MDCSKASFLVLHYLPEFAQSQVHWVCDAIQPFHHLSSSSPSALNLSWHQGLFQWISSSHQAAKLLEPQLQQQSFQWIFRVDFFRIDRFDFPAVQGTLRSLSTIVWKQQFFGAQLSLWSNSHIYTWLLEKPQFWLYGHLLAKWSLLCIMLSTLVIAFLPRIKCLLIPCLQSPSAVILETLKIKFATVSFVSPTVCTRSHNLSFWMLSFKPTFSLSSFTFSKRLFSSSSLSAIKVVSSAYLRLLIFLQLFWLELVNLPA